MTSVALPHIKRRCARAMNAAVATDTEVHEAGDGTRSLLVRRVNVRPVAAVAFVFFFASGVLALGAAIGIWTILNHLGAVAHVERLMVELGFETFELQGESLLRVAAIVAGSAVVAGTLLVAVAAELFNIVNRLVGGLSIRVAERPTSAPATETPPPDMSAGNVYFDVSEPRLLETPAPPPGRRPSTRALERRRRRGSDRVRGRRAPAPSDSRPAAP